MHCVSMASNSLLRLCRCLQHPYLYAEDIEPKNLTPNEAHEKLIDASAKLRLLKVLLPKLKEGGHRVLLFSQVSFTSGIKITHWFSQVCNRTQCDRRFFGWRTIQVSSFGALSVLISNPLFNAFYLQDGNTKGSVRQKAMDEFNKPRSDYFIFLLTTRAGVSLLLFWLSQLNCHVGCRHKPLRMLSSMQICGLLIVAQTADTVIIFDPDFNPHQVCEGPIPADEKDVANLPSQGFASKRRTNNVAMINLTLNFRPSLVHIDMDRRKPVLCSNWWSRIPLKVCSAY